MLVLDFVCFFGFEFDDCCEGLFAEYGSCGD